MTEVFRPSENTPSQSAESSSEQFGREKLERLARMTGRTLDDKDVVALNLALCYERYQASKKMYEDAKNHNSASSQLASDDYAVAKHELEEAVCLYDPTLDQMDEDFRRKQAKDQYIARAGRTTGRQVHQKMGHYLRLAQARKARKEGYDVKVAGKHFAEGEDTIHYPGYDEGRSDIVERLSNKLGKIVEDIQHSEIYQVYQANMDSEPMKERVLPRPVERLSRSEVEGIINQTVFADDEARKLVSEKMPPRYALGMVGGAEIYASHVAQNTWSRYCAVLYVKSENDDRIHARFFYRSDSSMLWRFAPSIGDHGYIFKSDFGEDAVNAPFFLQKTFEEIRDKQAQEVSSGEVLPSLSSERNVGGLISEDFDKIGVALAEPKLFFKGEHGDISDYVSKSEMGQALTAEQVLIYPVLGDRTPRLELADPWDLVVSESKAPDFSNQLYEWRSKSKIYGNVIAHCYESRDNSIRYLFFEDEKGGVWVGAVEPITNRGKEVSVSSLGLNDTFIIPGSLTTPLYDYHVPDEIYQDARRGGGFWGDQKDRIPNSWYVGMRNYVSQIPMVREYMDYRRRNLSNNQ